MILCPDHPKDEPPLGYQIPPGQEEAPEPSPRPDLHTPQVGACCSSDAQDTSELAYLHRIWHCRIKPVAQPVRRSVAQVWLGCLGLTVTVGFRVLQAACTLTSHAARPLHTCSLWGRADP